MGPDPKVVILCGGEGTRLREETEFKPKPMVTIGGMPILWHIMKIYQHHGFSDFVLCLGYKGEMIREFFSNAQNFGNEIWNVEMIDTGKSAMTGARLKKIEKFVSGDFFLATYGDAVSNVNLQDEVSYAMRMGRIATLAGVHPHSKFGLVHADKDGLIERFQEKPVLEEYVNGGFYVFKTALFDYLTEEDSCVLETGPMNRLAQQKQLSMFRHEGFWHSMDTYKDFVDLNRMWDAGNRPWKAWE